MNNTPPIADKKLPGRPRLYGSASEKVDAFRKRQESAGYIRKEILVTKETWEQVSTLALAHGVSAADAASGLLEQGLNDYMQNLDRRALVQVAPPGPSTLSGVATRFRSVAENEAIQASGASNVSRHRRALQSSMSLQSTTGHLGANTSENPITRFFAKRKDSRHD